MSADRDAADGDSSSGSTFDNPDHVTPSGHEQISRPRPQSQVSFRLPRIPDGETVNDLSQSDPCTVSSTFMASASSVTSHPQPRNRRRLFRDISYTARAVRRDNLPRGGRSSLFSPGSGVGGGAATATAATGGGHNSSSSSTTDSHHDSRPTLQRSSRHIATPAPPRRQESFRGRTRRRSTISGARAGGNRTRSRIKEYCEERTHQFQTFANRNNENHSSAGEESNAHLNHPEQYHIPPPEESDFSLTDAFFQLYTLAFGDVAMWVYGASFGKVLLFFLMLYMIFVYVFVVTLYLVDKYYAESFCIKHVGDGGELSTRTHFEFAFELSWTTFTTVGYGNVGPPSDFGCYPIRFLCSVEAICGMAFVSMCSGLFYAKLLRLLGRAQVTFSSTICVQYGKGLQMTGKAGGSLSYNKLDQAQYGGSLGEEEKENEKGESSSPISSPRSLIGSTVGKEESFHPYPVIEFRIVNNRANYAAGKNEIWDAEVTAIVQLSIENDPHENIEAMDSFRVNASSRWKPPAPSEKPNNDTFNKGQKVYYKLALKPAFHPYFSRVWILRHTLDATSPLLRREVRQMIRDRGGWDPAWNKYRDIREYLVVFNNLQIIMSGASALSRSEVYAEKMYSYGDVCVGWRYVAVCYEGEENSETASWKMCSKRLNKKIHRKKGRHHFSYGDDTTTRVDLSLIHDIVPQRGGDFEPAS